MKEERTKETLFPTHNRKQFTRSLSSRTNQLEEGKKTDRKSSVRGKGGTKKPRLRRKKEEKVAQLNTEYDRQKGKGSKETGSLHHQQATRATLKSDQDNQDNPSLCKIKIVFKNNIIGCLKHKKKGAHALARLFRGLYSSNCNQSNPI
ncbi:hypothetical protein CI102_15083 [Trichoderma harzianum]|nr:hypothetical protein CI102_15083 [Trichoderma harzianum]